MRFPIDPVPGVVAACLSGGNSVLGRVCSTSGGITGTGYVPPVPAQPCKRGGNLVAGASAVWLGHWSWK